MLTILAGVATGIGLLLLAAVVVPLPRPQVLRASEIYDVSGKLATKLFIENRSPVPLSRVPDHLQLAVISIEDPRFYRHFGIDPFGIARALVRNIMAGRIVQGGSTITQQLARNLYLTQERTLSRKLRELFLTLQLESRFAKTEILEMYLNQIYFGFGAYGVEAASELYFGKPVDQLTLAEGALLAGMPGAPEVFSPFRNPGLAQSRRNLVLDRMAELGKLPAAVAATAKEEEVKAAGRPVPHRTSYFIDFVMKEVRDRHPDLERDILRGGYRIYTTMDLRMQEAAEDAFANFVIEGTPDKRGIPQPQGALVAIDPRNGYVKALVGGRNPENPTYNRAVQARRQPGSAFKPFLYAAVLSGGFTAVDQQLCEYVSFPGASAEERYVPTDYTGGGRRPPYHNRAMGIREAIEISDNVVAVKWASTVGPEQVVNFARAMGIESPLEPSLPIALGTSEVTPLEMATAYAPFANMGWRVKPLAIRRLVGPSGQVVEENRPTAWKVIDEGVAFILTDIMKGVLTRGTAANLGTLDRPAAAKTGTTDESDDAWFIGYTPDLVTAIWVGNDTPSPLPGTGATLAGPIWASFMRGALSGREAGDFPQPSTVIRVAVSAADGLLPNPTSPVIEELFVAGTEPFMTSPQYGWGGWGWGPGATAGAAAAGSAAAGAAAGPATGAGP